MATAAQIQDKVSIACAALDAYHALLDRAATEVGTGRMLSRPLVRGERDRAAHALLLLSFALNGSPCPAAAYQAIDEIREGVRDGYSRAEWMLRVRQIVASCPPPAPAEVE